MGLKRGETANVDFDARGDENRPPARGELGLEDSDDSEDDFYHDYAKKLAKGNVRHDKSPAKKPLGVARLKYDEVFADDAKKKGGRAAAVDEDEEGGSDDSGEEEGEEEEEEEEEDLVAKAHRLYRQEGLLAQDASPASPKTPEVVRGRGRRSDATPLGWRPESPEATKMRTSLKELYSDDERTSVTKSMSPMQKSNPLLEGARAAMGDLTFSDSDEE
jgi:hypothetical protein